MTYELDLSTIITIICFILSETIPFVTNHQVNGILHFILMVLHKFHLRTTNGESTEQAVKEILEEELSKKIKD